MISIRLLILIALLTPLVGCATNGLDSVSKTTRLSPGMHYDEVVTLFGEPTSARTTNDNWIATWSLHQPQKGFVPYDLIFNRKQLLISWGVNEATYQRNRSRAHKIVVQSRNI